MLNKKALVELNLLTLFLFLNDRQSTSKGQHHKSDSHKRSDL